VLAGFVGRDRSMQPSSFLDDIKSKPYLLGVCLMYPAAGIIEGMAQGWDLVWIDGQHGQLAYRDVLEAVRVTESMGLYSIVRVPTHDAGILGKYADMAPTALMVPMVNNVEEARAVVRAVRFAPEGCRSYGGRRVVDVQGREYHRQQHLHLLAQIETVEAVQQADAIAAVEGVDGLFYGPDDMRVQLGLPMDTDILSNAQLKEGLVRTGEAAAKAGKYCGTVCMTGELKRACLEAGYRLLVGGGDISFLATGAKARLELLRADSGGEGSGRSSEGIYGQVET